MIEFLEVTKTYGKPGKVPPALENVSFVASYGYEFDDTFQGDEDLVSKFGINFGFGRGPLHNLPGLAGN